MRHRFCRWVLGAVAAGLVLTGCMSLGPETKARRLADSIEKYNKLVRWAEYERAIVFLEHSQQEVAFGAIKGLKDIRVTSYEIKRQTLAADQNSADCIVQFTFFNEYSGREREYIDRQHWVWYEAEGNWRMHGALPRFEVIRR